ncbi:MAG: hypothetical protein A3F42_08475 [Gammaproteobacteria bacterium RIFCSPHIGHO2_12_FULL_37_34]|nr:MAG: hypothetical protein A3F42_08475 [Gammaproteobacteria bacterium RIFCSPHIGHO2_12_FULL_37_34]
MKVKLIIAFQQALREYCRQSSRGYRFGFFSRWRHRFNKTQTLVALEKALYQSENDDEALSIVLEHFLSKQATFHNHSFNNYFIDELKKSIFSIHWNCFTPHAIAMYQGPLYRGTSQPPGKIFTNGFKELSHSMQVEDYLKFRTNRIGVSTSKNFDCAKEYAMNSKRSSHIRYIYAINYRGCKGYDILESGKARGLSFNRLFHKDRFSSWKNHKHEVNIKGHIVREDVIGAWQIIHDENLIWLDNQYYLKHAKFQYEPIALF